MRAHTDPEDAEPLIERLIEDTSSSGEGVPEAARVLARVAEEAPRDRRSVPVECLQWTGEPEAPEPR